MPNQRAIAAAAGVTQAAVSRALRGDRSISPATRQRIERAAKRLGYRPNAYVSSLMTHIRSGRPLRDKGCIAVLVDAASEREWSINLPGSYTQRLQYRGIKNRAEALGFSSERFFLQEFVKNPLHIDHVLTARGISGVVLMPQRPGSSVPSLAWARYASAAIAYTWSGVNIDRVSTHHRHNVETAFSTLLSRNYEKIGMCLPPEAMTGADFSWRERFLLWQDRLPKRSRIPLFVGKPGLSPIGAFRVWMGKWKPDALIGLVGHEKEWLDEMGLRTPQDIGMACVNRPLDSSFSGVEENHEAIGATALDLVASQIQRNEFGSPPTPKIILIEGTWVEGKTLRLAGDRGSSGLKLKSRWDA